MTCLSSRKMRDLIGGKIDERGFILIPIITIIQKKQPSMSKDKYVYNLEVEDDNSYIANSAIVHNCDDDIVPPINTLERFLQADKDIIGAVAFAMKYENGVGFPYPVTLRYNEEKKYIVYYGQGIEECDATGGATVMFKRKVYEMIERPYEFQYYRDGTLALTCDFDVLQKAQKKGFKLFIDFSLICDHIRTMSIKSMNDLMVREKKEDR
jgi:ATP sulfurylase